MRDAGQLLLTIDRGFVVANVVEAALWFAVAALVVVKWRHAPAAIVLVTFGVSDLVETTTGAWWRPWWLLVWKAVCVVLLVAILLLAWRRGRQGGAGNEARP